MGIAKAEQEEQRDCGKRVSIKITKGILTRAAIILVLAVAMVFLFSYEGTIHPAITAAACVVGAWIIYLVWKR